MALTLREVCGLTTEEIAHAFLTSPSTVAQRIVRAKAKIRDAPFRIKFRRVPTFQPVSTPCCTWSIWCSTRIFRVRRSVTTRHDLSAEALRLGRLLVELLPEAEVIGLLALMLLHESRRAARTTESGELVLLDEQDRMRWNRDQIAEGCALVERALTGRRFGHTLQAAIAAVHAEAKTSAGTTGGRSSGSTTCCCVPIHRRSSN